MTEAPPPTHQGPRPPSLENLERRLRERRWNVFLFLGLAIILFLFGLTPMPYPGPFASSSMLEDSTPGYIETDLPFVWGLSFPGDDATDVRAEIIIHTERVPAGSDAVDVYLLAGRCSTLGVEAYAIAEAEGDAWGEGHHWRSIERPEQGGTLTVDIPVDPGRYCLTVQYHDTSSGTDADLAVQARLHQNLVPGLALGTVCLSISIAAFIAAQSLGREVKDRREGPKRLTTEEQVLSNLGPAGPPPDSDQPRVETIVTPSNPEPKDP